MNCKDVNRIVAANSVNSALPFEVWEHAATCQHCQTLLGTLDAFSQADAVAPEIVHRIQQELLGDLRPVRPLIGTKFLLLGFGAIFVAIVAVGAYHLGDFDIAALSPVQLTTIFGTLALSAALLTYSLTQQMVPGRGQPLHLLLVPIAAPAALFIEVLLLFQPRHEVHFWAHDWGCLRVGIVLAAGAAVPLWLILRRGVILSAPATGATAGLLAGLVGTSVLEIRCPNLNAWHILSSHLGVAVFSALCGLAIGWAQSFFARCDV